MILGFLTAPAALLTLASGLSCSDAPVSVHVKPIIKSLELVSTKSTEELTLNHESGRVIAFGKVNGLGGGIVSLDTRTEFRISSLGSEACVKLDSIDVSFIIEPRIHIARDLRKGSCEYNAVLRHEQKHIAALKGFHNEYYPKLLRYVRKLALEQKTVRRINIAQTGPVQERISARIHGALQGYNKKIITILEKRQDALDTKEEYTAISASCNNWK